MTRRLFSDTISGADNGGERARSSLSPVDGGGGLEGPASLPVEVKDVNGDGKEEIFEIVGGKVTDSAIYEMTRHTSLLVAEVAQSQLWKREKYAGSRECKELWLY